MSTFASMFDADKYIFFTNSTFLDYEFESTGPRGTIKKVARFSLLDTDLYNFGFGDLNVITGEISDTVISNNADIDKILFTLASIIYEFTGVNPNAAVLIQGSTASRTRRYQMGIGKHLEEISKVFEVWGLQNNQWEPFKKGSNYEAFVGKRKKTVL